LAIVKQRYVYRMFAYNKKSILIFIEC